MHWAANQSEANIYDNPLGVIVLKWNIWKVEYSFEIIYDTKLIQNNEEHRAVCVQIFEISDIFFSH